MTDKPPTMDDAIAAGDGTLHGAIEHWQERATRAEAERDELRREVEALRRDAERWRYIRQAEIHECLRMAHYTGTALDAAIDAARKGESK